MDRPETIARMSARRRGAARRLAGMLPWVALAVAGVLGPGALPSCAPPAAPPEPDILPGLPTIRVRLTAQPADTVELSTTGGYRLRVDGRTVAESDGALPSLTVRRTGGTWQLNQVSAAGREVSLEPLPNSHVRLGGVIYRGRLRLLPEGNSRFVVINRLDMESYLAGVLAKELYPSWMDETYRALAIAARTFALYHVKTFGKSHEYDVGDDQSSQVYGGFAAETDRSWRAVRQTQGCILAWGPAGHEQIFMAQYSACCGGRVNGAAVLRNAPDIRPLAGGQECTDCSACRLYRWPAVRIPKAEILEALRWAYPAAKNLDGIKDLKVISATPYGRCVWIDAVAPNGRTLRVRADDLRLALLRSGAPHGKPLYSMNCRFRAVGEEIEFHDGQGFGHGVGLCQWGAQGKAEKGRTAEQILEAYYPGATILRAY